MPEIEGSKNSCQEVRNAQLNSRILTVDARPYAHLYAYLHAELVIGRSIYE